MRERFPLIGDDETIVAQSPAMDLYDDWDLISNIQGPYEERIYVREGGQADLRNVPDTSEKVYRSQLQYEEVGRRIIANQKKTKSVVSPHKLEEAKFDRFSYTQLARAQAREDLKRKRSAPYLNFDKPGFKSKELPKPKPTQRDLDKEQMDDLARASRRLRQTTYILAEIKSDLQQEASEETNTPKKNNYDFLKTSQIYNYRENHQNKVRKATQELNLTRFGQWKE